MFDEIVNNDNEFPSVIHVTPNQVRNNACNSDINNVNSNAANNRSTNKNNDNVSTTSFQDSLPHPKDLSVEFNKK